MLNQNIGGYLKMNSEVKLYCELISGFKLQNNKTNEDIFNLLKQFFFER